MANGLKVIKTEEELESERIQSLEGPFPWEMLPFPFAAAKVESDPPRKSDLREPDDS